MNDSLVQHVGRRTFLKLLGAAAPAVAASACSSVPPERIIPYVVPPEDDVPGVATWYASSCGECPAGCGTRVRTREGRAVKIEGNPEHPINRGRLCIRGQAALQGLYNPDRIRGAHRREVMPAGQSRLVPVAWDDALVALTDRVRMLRDEGRANRIAIVTPLISGSLDRLFDAWAKATGARRVRYRAVRIRGDSNCQPTVLRTRGGSSLQSGACRRSRLLWRRFPRDMALDCRVHEHVHRRPSPARWPQVEVRPCRAAPIAHGFERRRVAGLVARHGNARCAGNDPGHRRRKAILRDLLTTT